MAKLGSLIEIDLLNKLTPWLNQALFADTLGDVGPKFYDYQYVVSQVSSMRYVITENSLDDFLKIEASIIMKVIDENVLSSNRNYKDMQNYIQDSAMGYFTICRYISVNKQELINHQPGQSLSSLSVNQMVTPIRTELLDSLKDFQKFKNSVKDEKMSQSELKKDETILKPESNLVPVTEKVKATWYKKLMSHLFSNKNRR